jgi:putative sigma-54 modulation protein
MKIAIRATNMSLTDSLRDHVTQKFMAIDRIIKGLETKGELFLKIELALTTKHHNKGDVYYVECMLDLPGNVIRIEQYDEDMHAAIDKAQNRLKVEAEQFKRKISTKDRKEIERLKGKAL